MLRLMSVTRSAVLVALALVLAGCGPATDPGVGAGSPAAREANTAAAPRWSQGAGSPLTARHSALAVAVGEEVLILGGNASPVCPPAASCGDLPQYLSDGAVYFPKTRTWRPIAPSPVAPSSGSVAEHRGLVYLLTEQHLHSYDLKTDTWTRLPAPPDTGGRLMSAGAQLLRFEYTQEGGQVRADHLYDPTARSWRALPRDPLAPTFDRGAVWAGDRIVLLGKPEPPPPVDGVESETIFVHAATFDVTTWTWSQVPQRDEVIGFGSEYFWTGSRVLLPYTFDYTQGDRNPRGSREPTGGLLDLATGGWERLPRPPSPPATPLRVRAGTASLVTAGEGFVLDVAKSRWSVLQPAPSAAIQGVAGAWVDRQLVVFGGGTATESGRTLSNQTWVWTQPS